MVDRLYPAELQLNKTDYSDAEAPFLDLNLSISNGTVSIKMYDKRDDFDFDKTAPNTVTLFRPVNCCRIEHDFLPLAL